MRWLYNCKTRETRENDFSTDPSYWETPSFVQIRNSKLQQLQEKYQEDIKAMRDEMNQQFSKIMSMIQQNPKLAHIKPEVLTKIGSK